MHHTPGAPLAAHPAHQLRKARALARDIRERAAATGCTTQQDLKAMGWSARQLAILTPIALKMLPATLDLLSPFAVEAAQLSDMSGSPAHGG
ncbi:hypothetical protein ACT6QH_02095 [Xanthobacter sp. TB0139]|uniref:hypothetical protein n=1 Tax=Xanthobacter sp. TB0139 TaxID=3459178 RepID=UPI004039384F